MISKLGGEELAGLFTKKIIIKINENFLIHELVVKE